MCVCACSIHPYINIHKGSLRISVIIIRLVSHKKIRQPWSATLFLSELVAGFFFSILLSQSLPCSILSRGSEKRITNTFSSSNEGRDEIFFTSLLQFYYDSCRERERVKKALQSQCTLLDAHIQCPQKNTCIKYIRQIHYFGFCPLQKKRW